MAARLHHRTRLLTIAAAALLAAPQILSLGPAAPPASAASATTAWHDGMFSVDTASVVSRSDVVLGLPNSSATESMPLGNGMLGAAVWAAGGLSAQLNRVDAFPDGKSPGTLTVPGLSAMTAAADYSGRVALDDGVFTQSGGGITAKAYVRRDSDEFVVDVSGADPNVVQTAQVRVPSTRGTIASASGAIAALAESWTDNGWNGTGASGRTFGTLAALTVGGTAVTASVADTHTIKVTFKPNADGTFRIVVGAPAWSGGDAMTTATRLLGTDATAAGIDAPTLSWWHDFWGRTAMLELGSSNGEAEYLENLRMLDLYTQAASSSASSDYPASHGGQANLFYSSGDGATWCTACYWHWNLRMEVSANLGAGAFDSNSPYFALYRTNLSGIDQWTADHMAGRAGACVPETMRFNGNGYSWSNGKQAAIPECDATYPAWYNSRTVSTGAEVGLWIWRQYQYAQDQGFLGANYPVMADAARFLLAYATTDADGHLETSPSNAHETQWDTSNPTTDIAAMRALFPAVVQAATMLGVDGAPGGLVDQLNAAIAKIRPFRHTTANGADVIAMSDKDGGFENSENIGLEPLWPYGVVTDDSGADFAAEQRTYANRNFVSAYDWTPDPIDAAHLDEAADVRTQLLDGTARFQPYVNGFDELSPNSSPGRDQYLEWNANVATALQDALVQADDGTLRIAPAWPSQWNAAGSVFIPGGHKVDVQYVDGAPSTVAVEAGSTQTITVRNPWPGQRVQVVDGTDTSTVLVPGTTAASFSLPLTKGSTYLIEQADSPSSTLPFAQVTGIRAAAAKTLGSRTIGLVPPTSGGLPGTVHLLNSNSNLVLDDPGSSKALQTVYVQNPADNAADETFTATPEANGTYQLKNNASGQCLGVISGSKAAGASVDQYTCDTGANHLWSQISVGSGFELVDSNSGLCLDITGASTAAGATAVQNTCTGSAGQTWKIG